MEPNMTLNGVEKMICNIKRYNYDPLVELK